MGWFGEVPIEGVDVAHGGGFAGAGVEEVELTNQVYTMLTK